MAASPGHALFTGSFAALEARFLDEVRRRKAGDPLRAVDVLVGSNLLGVYLRRRAAEALGGVANLRFLTFLDLARERAAEPDPRPPLPPLGEALLSRRVLRENEAGAEFGALRERPSAAALLARTANDLRDAGLSPDRLASLLPSVAATPDRARLLGAVSALTADLEARRCRFADATALLARAAAVRGAPTEEPLLVYGLYDLGGVRERLLAAVAAERPVLAFVPGDGRDELPPAEAPPVRRALFERLLGVPATPLAGPPPLAPVSVVAPSESAEARETVRELLCAVDENVPLHACAILLRDPARQEPALLAELRRRRIPFFRPAGGGFSRSPHGRTLRRLLSLAVGGFAADEAVALAEALEGSAGLAAGTASRLARLFGELRFQGGLDDLKRRLDRIRPGEGPGAAGEEPEGRLSARARRLREARVEAEAFLGIAVPALPPCAPAPFPEWARRLSASATACLPAGLLRDALEGALASIAALDDVVRGEDVPAEEVLALLPDTLESVPVREGRFERDGVAVLSAVSARGLLFEVVLVPGLGEQLFPRPGRPDPLLFDEERRALARQTGAPLVPRTGARHAREERFLFEVARSSARRRVVLLAPRREAATDRPRLLSPYLLDELAAVAGRRVRERELASPGVVPGLRWLPLGARAFDGPALDGNEALERALAADPGLATRLASAPEGLTRALERTAARAADFFTDREGRLGRTSERLRLGGRPLSASRLEGRAACAYRAFLEDGLGLAAPDEPADALDLDAPTLGTLAHAVLERLARAGGTRGLAALDERSLRPAARAEVERLFASLEIEPPPPLVQATEALVLSRVGAVVRHESLRPSPLPVAGTEVRFGPGEAAAPRVALPSGEVSLAGRIDRLDRGDGAALVVDYKFGKSTPFGRKNAKGCRIAGGERLQLAVYALAARELGVESPRAEYLFVERRDDAFDAVPVVFDADATQALVDSLHEALRFLDEAAESGELLPKTAPAGSKESHCGRCPFDAVCGPGHRKVFDRKREAERALTPLPPLLALERLP